MKPQRIYRNLFCKLAVLLLTIAGKTYAQSAYDTIPVFFAFNEDALNRHATSMFDSLRYEEILNPGQKLMIIGYADFVGTGQYNEKLSRQRAQSVKNYLLTLGFHDANVQLCIGKGEIVHTGMESIADGVPADRRVDVVVLRHLNTTRQNVPETKVADLPEEKHFAGLKKNITDYTPQETFKLENLYFPANKHYLDKGSEAVLDTLFLILKNHPRMRIRVEGHICCVTELPDAFDDDTHTYNLSVNRAKYIRNYLMKKGITGQRIEYQGFGRRVPVEPVEVTEEQARRNRRVEIRILSQ